MTDRIEQDPAFSHQLVGARRGFEALACGVVDVDVSPLANVTVFDSLDDVRRTYEGMAESLPPDELDHDVLQGYIAADLMFARALGGEEFGLKDYVETTVGLTPELVPEATIQAKLTEVDSLLQQKGLRYDQASSEKFQEMMVITDPREVEQRFRAAHQAAQRSKSGYLDLPDELPEVRFESLAGEPWSAWFTTGPARELLIRVNTHPEHRHTAGKLAALALHEDAHATQMGLWKQGINRGEVSPALGLTAMHSPENTQLEAVAQLIESTPPAALSEAEQWSIDYQLAYNDLKSMVQHNAHFMINDGTDEKEVLAYASERLPFEWAERLAGDLEAGRDDPMARAALAVYIPSLELVRPLVELPPAIRQQAITRLMPRPLTPTQIAEIVRQAQAEAETSALTAA